MALGRIAGGAFALFVALTFSVAASAQEQVRFRVNLSGDQNVPAYDVPGQGAGELTYYPQSHVLFYQIQLSPPYQYGYKQAITSGELHGPARPGETAQPFAPLRGSDAPGILAGQVTLTPQAAQGLMNGLVYVTATITPSMGVNPKPPFWVVRGQILPETMRR